MFQNLKSIIQAGVTQAGEFISDSIPGGAPAFVGAGGAAGFFIGLALAASIEPSFAVGLGMIAASVVATPVAAILVSTAVLASSGFLVGAIGAFGKKLRDRKTTVQPGLIQQLEDLSPEDSARVLTTLLNKAELTSTAEKVFTPAASAIKADTPPPSTAPTARQAIQPA